MRTLAVAVLLATLLPAAGSPQIAARSRTLAHNGYGIEYPRGCKLVFTTVRVNGVDVVLRQVKCPKGKTATS